MRCIQLLDTTIDYRQTKSDKKELIEKCVERIKSNKKLIQSVKQNKHLSVAEKQQKIKHLQGIVSCDEFTIKQARDFLKTGGGITTYNRNR